MSGKDKTCTISGMRPHKLPECLDRFELLGRLEREMRKSISMGYTIFQLGMAMGIDIWAAELALKLKLEFPEIRLRCYLPCETQADKWPDEWREKYFSILAKADDVICLQTHYTAGCMPERNRKMIDTSSRLIAVHDGVSSGGTAQTISYAKRQWMDIAVINPLDYLSTHVNL